MRVLILAALAAFLPPADEPATTVVIELGNVCGRDCVALLEKALAKIDGVKKAEMYGDKFHFLLTVAENKALLPSSVLKVVDRIKEESKGEEEFPLQDFVATLSGSAEKKGDDVLFTARGSGQKYSVKPDAALAALLAAGKTKVTLTGKVDEPKDRKLPPTLELTEAKETPK